jgi:hypothetical protein
MPRKRAELALHLPQIQMEFHRGDEMAGKRELIEPNEGDKRFVRRDEEGKFTESDDVSRSLSQDQKRDAKNKSKKGHGDKGDRE